MGTDARHLDRTEPATSTTFDSTCLPFAFPSVQGKKLTAASDSGRLTSDGDVPLLAQAARWMRIVEKLTAVIPDRGDPSQIVHPLSEILILPWFHGHL